MHSSSVLTTTSFPKLTAAILPSCVIFTFFYPSHQSSSNPMDQPQIFQLHPSTHPKLYKQFLQLRQDILRAPIGLNLFTEDLSSDETSYLIIAVLSDQVIGCLILTPCETNNNSTFKLRQMAVASEFRGKGIGSSLVQFAEQFSKNKGVYKIALHARTPAVPFYTKLGYSVVGNEFIEVGIPHFAMKKDLSQ